MRAYRTKIQSRFSRKQSLKRKIFILYFRLLFSRRITPFPLVPPVTIPHVPYPCIIIIASCLGNIIFEILLIATVCDHKICVLSVLVRSCWTETWRLNTLTEWHVAFASCSRNIVFEILLIAIVCNCGGCVLIKVVGNCRFCIETWSEYSNSVTIDLSRCNPISIHWTGLQLFSFRRNEPKS